MISIMSKLGEFKNALRSGAVARLLAVILGGSLNQRAFVLIGLLLILGSVYYLLLSVWGPLLIIMAGSVLTYLAIKDYERSVGKKF